MRVVDIHCHLLPGVDDGPSSMEETRTLLRAMHEEGVRVIVVTPHYRPDMFEASMKTVSRRYVQVRQIAAQLGIRVYLGCEHYRNSEMIHLLEDKRRPAMAGTEYVLVEFSPGDSFQMIRNYVYTLGVHGFLPIVAHVERYACCQKVERVRELKKLGAFIQVNADTILGKDGWQLKRYGKMLIREDLVDFIASDCHDSKVRKPNLGRCAAYIEKKYGEHYAKRIFQENPVRMIRSRRTS